MCFVRQKPWPISLLLTSVINIFLKQRGLIVSGERRVDRQSNQAGMYEGESYKRVFPQLYAG